MSGVSLQQRSALARRGRAVLAGLAAALVAIAGACSSNPYNAGARLAGPTDLVLFTGITSKRPGVLHQYLAVTSSRSDSLALVDPADDQPVLSPMIAYPLAIPTAPRPILVAAAALGDGGADVLVAATGGSLTLQVVETWTSTNRVVPSASVSLEPALGDAQILSLVGITPASASASPRGRILVGASGGRLVVVDFVRDTTTGGVVAQQPIVKDVGFDPLAVTLEPGGGPRAFFATTDPLSSGGATVHGVAFLDVSGDPTLAWTPTVIDAGGPTTALAVGLVRERQVDPTNPAAPNTFDVDPKLRVYAIVDPTACGRDRDLACGVVTLDEQGLLPDPSGELPARAPLPVPAIPAGITIALPPASGSNRVVSDPNNPGVPLMTLNPGGRNTSAVGAVTSSDGNVYLYDLGRYAPAMSGSALVAGGGVSSVVSVVPADVTYDLSANFGKDLALGLWNDFPVAPAAGAAVSTDALAMPAHVQVTPGITPTDLWVVTWQGVLPSLASRPGIVGRTASGETYVALQANAGTVSSPAWVASVNVADAALGIHGADLVTFAPDDSRICPAPDAAHPYPELVVSASAPLLAPDTALFPGGALQVGSGSCFDALAPGTFTSGIVTVRASGLVLTSNLLGYLGRPTFDQPFMLAHQDERTATGEALVVSRKIRRSFYPIEPPCSPGAGQPAVAGCYPGFPLIADPLAPGPAIAFHVGLVPTLDPGDPAVLARIPRGARLMIQTSTGVTPGGIMPISGGVLPTRMLPFDRTGIAGHENDATTIFTVYRDDQLLDFSPSYSGGNRQTLH